MAMVRAADAELGSIESLADEIGRVAKIGAWRLDLATGAATCTAEMARMHEIDPADPACLAQAVARYRGAARAELERALAARLPYDLLLERINPSGELEHVRALGRPIAGDGRVVELRGTFQIVTELQRAEDERRRDDRLLRMFVESAPGAVAMFDREMRYLAASRRFLSDLRRPAQDLLGRSHYDVFPEIPARWREIHARCLAGATERCDEDPWPRPDGTLDWITWELRPWHDATGDIGGVVLFSEVVTERKRGEEALRESEHRFRAMFEQSPVGKAELDVATDRFVRVNAKLCEILGRSREELLGLTTADVTHPDDLGAERARVQVKRYIRADGSIRWVRVTAGHLETGSGPGSELGAVEDITDLRGSDAQVRAVFDTVPLGLALVEYGTGRITRANARLAEILGYTREELVGRSIRTLTHPDDQPRTAALSDDVRAGRIETAHLEKRYLHKSGRVVWADVRFAALNDGARDLGTDDVVVTIDDITERRAAEVTRRLQTTALEAAANAIAITDAAGELQWVNSAFEALTGYRRDEVIGQNPRVLRSGRQDAAFYRRMWETILAGEVWHGELINRRKDGTPYHEDQTVTPVRDASGAITHFIAIKQDISERKHGEDAVHESEARLRAVIASLPIPIAVATVDGRVMHYNAAFTERFGYTLDDAPTIADWMAVAYPDERQRTAILAEFASDMVLAARHDLPTARRQHRVTCKNGTVRDVQSVSRIVGELNIAVFDDITERRHAEDALRASEERYRTLVDSLDDVIFSLDPDGTITFISRAVEGYGYRPEDCVGRAMTDFVEPDERAKMIELNRRRMAGDLDGRVEYRLRDAKGELRNVQITTRATGRGLIGIAVDVTAQRHTEEQLRAAQKMEAVGRLAGGVAHDFNNILTVILSFSELAQAQLRAGDPLRADLDEIIQATLRASGLTRQLLAFSRRQVLQPEPVDLDALVASLGKMLHRLIGEDIELELPSSHEALTSMVDRGQIEQVVMNLVVNARDAMPDGGRITIATGAIALDAAAAFVLDLPAGEYVRLSVADTGTGMDAATRARIFEPFFTTKEQGKGTGLGLSTVYGIVKQSRGGIAVDSEVGAGSTFTIFLPSDGEETRAAAARAAAPERGHETILIVEDEVQLRTAVRRVLSSVGYHVHVAGTPSEALRLATAHGASVNLILTDVVMPEMNGRELARRLRPLCPSARILYTSGYTDDALVRSGVLGEEFLPKPFDPATLSRRIRSLLDTR